MDKNINETQKQCTIHSVIHWVAVADKLPELEKNVMIVCKDGYVGWGMRAERVVVERSPITKLYERTNKKWK